MSMTPITPTTTPAPLQNTGQIRHYEDEWVQENTITCHSARRIPYELLTEPLIQVIRGCTVLILNIWQISSCCLFSSTHGQPNDCMSSSHACITVHVLSNPWYSRAHVANSHLSDFTSNRILSEAWHQVASYSLSSSCQNERSAWESSLNCVDG